MSDIVIRVENLSKSYQLGIISHGTLYHDLQSWWARMRGKEDPNMKITDHQRSGQSGERFWALKDISFDVKQGEILGIIGRNGAGKSTLLKILSKITSPTKGCVKLKGRFGSLLEVGTGFHPELTGRENIYLNGAVLGMNKSETAKKFDEIVDFASIEEFIDTPVKRYSSGMYVRLAFAVAAHLEPEIMLVDEVLAVGDVEFRKKCLGKMGDVTRQGRTVLFVSHNMMAVSELCSRTIWLDNGTIVKSGKTQEVIDAYLSKARGLNNYQGADLSYADDPEKSAQIKRIRIVDSDGKPSLQHDLLSPIRIEIDFVVRRYFPNLFVACTVRTPMDQVVFSTNEMDWENHIGTKKNMLQPKKPGQYRCSVELPAPLLHTGIYELLCILANPDVGRIETIRNIFIEILDDHGSFMAFPIKGRQGIIAIPLQWQVERIE